MTERNAQHVCKSARALYGDQVTTSIETACVYGRPSCIVNLEHKGLNRRLSIGCAGDWSSIQDAWSCLLEEYQNA